MRKIKVDAAAASQVWRTNLAGAGGRLTAESAPETPLGADRLLADALNGAASDLVRGFRTTSESIHRLSDAFTQAMDSHTRTEVGITRSILTAGVW